MINKYIHIVYLRTIIIDDHDFKPLINLTPVFILTVTATEQQALSLYHHAHRTYDIIIS